MENLKRVSILGCPFDAITFPGTVEAIRNAVMKKKRVQIVPGSIDSVMKSKRDPVFREELLKADLVVADGVPIVWASSLLGDPIQGRVSGTDLVWSCAEVSAETGCTVAMIGGGEGVAGRAADKMQEKYPTSRLYAISTPFPLGKKENEDLVRDIKAIDAKIVLVALGAPRQERWVQSYLERCEACVGIGIGSAFDIICGDKPRAPNWMKDNGMEWLYRLKQDPKRLGRRYLVEDSPFLFHLAVEIVKRKIQMRRGA